jgi:hypothetical protein
MPMTATTRSGILGIIWRGVALMALLLSACAPGADRVVSARPQVLPLELGDDAPDIEFSGMCWWGDELFLLPQYPATQRRGVFVLHRDSLARAIGSLEAGRPVEALRPRRVMIDAGDVPEKVQAYDGLEALSLRDGRCFALAEFGENTDHWGSYLITGTFARDRSGISFERLGDTTLGGPQVRENYTHEALVLTEDEVWVLCELNGRRIVDRALLARFDHDLNPLPPLRMPALEYRITDATDLDADGRFWVLNLFWPPDVDTVEPEAPSGPVERIVPLRHVGDEIIVDPDLPILDLRNGGDQAMHNWEGVARWGDEGFLLVTDSYPANLLAYVALPE